MKYTSVIAAAAVLSASTFAGFNVGVEAGNLHLDGKRVSSGTELTIANLAWTDGAAFDEAVMHTNKGQDQIGAVKNVLGVRIGYDYDMSSMFTIDAGLVLSSGKLKYETGRTGVAHLAGQDATYVAEVLTVEYKPTYAFDLKALFNMSGIKFGPEIRITRMEQVNGGGVAEGKIDIGDTGAANTQITGDNISADGAVTTNKVKADKKDRDETMFGLAFSAPINDRLTLSGGYLTVKAKKMEAEFTTQITNLATAAVYGENAAFSKFDLQTEKPTLDMYYVSLGMSF